MHFQVYSELLSTTLGTKVEYLGGVKGTKILKYLNYHQLLHEFQNQEPNLHCLYVHMATPVARKLFFTMQSDNFWRLNTNMSKLIKITFNWDFYLSSTAGVDAGSHTAINVSDY